MFLFNIFTNNIFISGEEDDLPTDILQGAHSWHPAIDNPLLVSRNEYPGRADKGKYKRDMLKEPPSPPHKHNLRPKDKPGCGPPICSIIDMRIKTFKSMCHMVEYLVDNGRFRTIFDVQKGSCEESSKYFFAY